MIDSHAGRRVLEATKEDDAERRHISLDPRCQDTATVQPSRQTQSAHRVFAQCPYAQRR